MTRWKRDIVKSCMNAAWFAVTRLHLTDLSMRFTQQVRSRCNICTCSDVVEIGFWSRKVIQQSVTPTQKLQKAVWFVVWLVVWLAVWLVRVVEVDHNGLLYDFSRSKSDFYNIWTCTDVAAATDLLYEPQWASLSGGALQQIIQQSYSFYRYVVFIASFITCFVIS